MAAEIIIIHGVLEFNYWFIREFEVKTFGFEREELR